MFTQITTSLQARKTINNGLNFTHLFGTKYSRMDQVKFVGDSLYKISLSPFLNTLSDFMMIMLNFIYAKSLSFVYSIHLLAFLVYDKIYIAIK